ncbi:hypothetical protein GOBAR_DD27530 [Gossypium barbadense]|nr:hypothetical protein GOBAR_DD27530 [Gossypium barbadense]
MELKNRVEEENCLMNEALLLATMYILGLPVDVHLRDGSVYSGIFHTAAVEKEFGGFCFLFWGVPLPFDGFAGNITHGNEEAAFEILSSSANPLNVTRKFNKSTMDKSKSNRKR